MGSPSSDTTPRSAPAIAFTFPVTMPSNTSLEVLITASAYILINLLVDLLYSLIDPRIRVAGEVA